MPSTSWKQHKFMEAIKHSPSFAKKAGVPQSVGQDFSNADDRAGITKSHEGQRHASYAHGGPVGGSMRYSKGGIVSDDDSDDNIEKFNNSYNDNDEDDL